MNASVGILTDDFVVVSLVEVLVWIFYREKDPQEVPVTLTDTDAFSGMIAIEYLHRWYPGALKETESRQAREEAVRALFKSHPKIKEWTKETLKEPGGKKVLFQKLFLVAWE